MNGRISNGFQWFQLSNLWDFFPLSAHTFFGLWGHTPTSLNFEMAKEWRNVACIRRINAKIHKSLRSINMVLWWTHFVFNHFPRPFGHVVEMCLFVFGFRCVSQAKRTILILRLGVQPLWLGHICRRRVSYLPSQHTTEIPERETARS